MPVFHCSEHDSAFRILMLFPSNPIQYPHQNDPQEGLSCSQLRPRFFVR